MLVFLVSLGLSRPLSPAPVLCLTLSFGTIWHVGCKARRPHQHKVACLRSDPLPQLQLSKSPWLPRTEISSNSGKVWRGSAAVCLVSQWRTGPPSCDSASSTLVSQGCCGQGREGGRGGTLSLLCRGRPLAPELISWAQLSAEQGRNSRGHGILRSSYCAFPCHVLSSL